MADWITTDQASELSGYHVERVRELAREGRIEAKKWGRDWMISQGSLLKYIRAVQKLGQKRGPKRELTDK